jgi:parvulin-like peptidyl-prolyl isomerase
MKIVSLRYRTTVLGVATILTTLTFATGSASAARASTYDNNADHVSSGSALPPGTVARVNDVSITNAEVDQTLSALHETDTPAARAQVKNQLIARELFRQAAKRAHYDTHADVVAAVEEAREQAQTNAMIGSYLRDELKPQPITDAALQAQYDAIVSRLGTDEWKPRAIVVKDADTAKLVLAQLKQGGDFAKLAVQYSQGADAARGGELNWVSFKTPIQPGQTLNWPTPLAEALVKLPQGAVSNTPIQVGDAYWILRVDQKRPTKIPTFAETAAPLRAQLTRAEIEKATSKIVVDLMKHAQIQQ